MPFDSTHGVVYGADSLNVEGWALETYLTALRTALNDMAGPYYTPLGLSPSRLVIVSSTAAVIEALYNEADSGPVVLGLIGPAESTSSGRTIGGTFYEGERVSVTLNLDMGVKDATPEGDVTSDNVVDEAQADRQLAGCVRHFTRTQYNQLAALGLNNISIAPDNEAQRAGAGRAPHTVNLFCIALDSYTPA